MIVSRSSSGIEISLVGFPLHMGVSPSLRGLLLAMVQRAKRERWDSVEVGTFVYAKSPFVEWYDFGSFVGGFDHETKFLNPKAPTRLRGAKLIDERTEFVKEANVESFNAIVVVIRNKPGKKQDSLPKLFEACAQFVEENDLDFDSVESIRYVSASDDKLRAYPELHLTVIKQDDEEVK